MHNLKGNPVMTINQKDTTIMRKTIAAGAAFITALSLTACTYDPEAEGADTGTHSSANPFESSESPSLFESNPFETSEPQKFTESDNAVRSAEQYLRTMPFSQQGLADQLVFEGYSTEDAQNAVATVDADWNEQAVESGRSYLDIMPMSQQELHDQLVFEKFTPEQAQFAVNQLFGEGQ